MAHELQATPLRRCLEKIIDYRGKTPKKLGSDWIDEGYRALSAINVKDSGLVSTETIRCVDAETYKKWMKEEVKRGDILLTSEAPAGEVMIWNSDEKSRSSRKAATFCAICSSWTSRRSSRLDGPPERTAAARFSSAVPAANAGGAGQTR